MGTDMQGFVEYRDNDTKQWEDLFAFPAADRHYEMFGRMAGVRWVELEMFPQRGLPNDLSYWGKIWLREFCEGYGYSYLSTEELDQVVQSLECPNLQAVGWLAAMKAVGESRIVFWFDN